MATNVNDWTHKDATMRIPVRTSRRPGRRSIWTAHLGEFSAEGTTERGAVTRLAESIATFAQVFNAPRILTFKGRTAVITARQNGYQVNEVTWTVETVRPTGGGVGHMSTGGTLAEVTASARNNLAHMATDWHDDASVHEGAAFAAGPELDEDGQYGRNEFYRYAAWQRAAKAAMDAGVPDFHRWASEHAKDFEVTRPA
jgi:hypothetical protein